MFAGLLLTSISTLTMRAALFQRKARSGWLEELDGIREDALVEPEGTVDDVVAADDIWTDLREGGEYEDPHEISSLYATDDTPDLPPPRSQVKAAKGRGRGRAKDVTPEPMVAEGPSIAPELDPVTAAPAATFVEDVAALAPEPLAPSPIAEVAFVDAPVVDEAELVASDPGGVFDAAPAWVQPAPHPIRPSEMWHPADLEPPALGDDAPWSIEERLHATDLDVPASSPGPFAPASPAALDPTPVAPVARALEDELVAASDAATVAPSAFADGGLVSTPVGRRVRRDRPAARHRPSSLPQPDAVASDGSPSDVGPVRHLDHDRSPLPEAPLPPAALPTHHDEIPAEPHDLVVEEPATPEPVAVSPLVPAADGMVVVPGTIVRLGGARRAAAARTPAGVVVELAEGWTWVAPGEGTSLEVVVELPNAQASIAPGATVLTVVEADGAAFVFVAAGTVSLRRGDEGASLARGAIAMLDPSGAAQVDQATDDELAADPIVAENLAADAEL